MKETRSKAFPDAVGAVLYLCLLAPAYLTLLSVLALSPFRDWYGADLRYFPGDAPVADNVLMFAPVGVLLCLGVLAMSLYLGGGRIPVRPLRVASGSMLLVLCLCSLVATGSVLYRFSPAWNHVRTEIRRLGDEILAASGGDRDRTLTSTEFERLKQRFLPEPVPVPLTGFGNVHLEMGRVVYPYVEVDFGAGRIAQFDPDTMICTYSD
jgi:hypothetical protein